MEFKIYRAAEAELIRKCVLRDRTAQKRLFDTYSPKMHALCLRYVRDSMNVEDIVVKAFTKILERIGQYKSEGSFEGWIRTIVINEALSYLRKNRTVYREADIEVLENEPDYRSLSDHLEVEDLMNMIHELPDGYRIVFNMYAIDGYSHKEIAEKLSISENTSKSQLSRARIYLQKLLAKSEIISKQQINDNATR